jgi:hypothetical protein
MDLANISVEDLLIFALKKFEDTRCLNRLPAVKHLDKQTKDDIADLCENSAGYLKENLDDFEATGSEVALLKFAMRYFGLPATFVAVTKLRPSAAKFWLELPGVPPRKVDFRTEEEKAEKSISDYIPYEQEANEAQAAAAVVKGAAASMRAGKPGLANRRMTSNGVAPATQENAQIAHDMHKRRTEDIRHLEPTVEQAVIHPDVYYKGM